MGIKSALSSLSYDDECFNIRILFRVLSMLLRGTVLSVLSLNRIVFPAFISRNVQIIGPYNKITAAQRLKIESNVIIQTDSIDGIKIGESCSIGAGTCIRPSSYYGGEKGMGLTLGHRTAIGVNSYIGCSGFIDIGDDVIIGPHFTVIAENHIFSELDKNIKEQGVTRGDVKIENNVWVGCNVTILTGVTIGSGSVVAAGAVVTKSFPQNSIIGGVPAKLIKRRVPRD